MSELIFDKKNWVVNLVVDDEEMADLPVGGEDERVDLQASVAPTANSPDSHTDLGTALRTPNEPAQPEAQYTPADDTPADAGAVGATVQERDVVGANLEMRNSEEIPSPQSPPAQTPRLGRSLENEDEEEFPSSPPVASAFKLSNTTLYNSGRTDQVSLRTDRVLWRDQGHQLSANLQLAYKDVDSYLQKVRLGIQSPTLTVATATVAPEPARCAIG